MKRYAAGLLFVLSACGSDPTGPSVRRIDGWWTGLVRNQGNAICIEIVQRGEELSGFGASFGLESAGGSWSYQNANVSGSITTDNAIELRITGVTRDLLWRGSETETRELQGALIFATQNQVTYFERSFAGDHCASVHGNRV